MKPHLGLPATATVVAAALAACGPPQPLTPAGPLVPTGMIFTAERTAQLAPMGAALLPPYWTPSPDEVAAAEARVAAALAAMSNERAYTVSRNLASYRRQYLGHSPGGRPHVVVNGFCGTFWERDASWQHRLVEADGDGACFFTADYDVEADSVAKLRIGGGG